MRIDAVTLFPRMFDALTEHGGVLGRAIQRDILTLNTWNPRDYANNKHNNVDDRPYGGGPGMLMQYQPLSEAIDSAKRENQHAPVIYLSPQGKRLNQQPLKRFAQMSGMILVCGRYEGVDERLIESKVDEEWSIGDYVLSGGELASMVLIDGVARLLPEVLGHEASAEQDSFESGLLDCPHYTRPENINGMTVPAVLLGGDHKAIEKWRLKQSLGRTWQRRPDLLKQLALTEEQQQLLKEYIQQFEETD